MKTTLIALCFALLAFTAMPALAQQDAAAEKLMPAAQAVTPPTRESLEAFFEEQMKNDPQVKDFTKRADGDYDFKTGFFPYTGRLKLLNAAVTGYDDQYYEGLYRGIVEVDLMDADEAFYKKYARSVAAWTQDLNYFYNAKKGKWFTSAQWDANAGDFDKYGSTKTAATGSCATTPAWTYLKPYLPLGVAIVFVLFLLLVARRANKRVWTNHAKALEEQQRGLKMAEESLVHQREHTRLLEEILAATKK